MGPETLTLENICGGALEEVFQREVSRLLANIRDVNTEAEQKRKLVIEFQFDPHPDRSGARVVMQVKTTLANIEPVKGNIHIAGMDGKLAAYPHDPRQELLFGQQAGAQQ